MLEVAAFAGIASPILRQAAERVALACRREAAEQATADEIVREIERLAGAVELGLGAPDLATESVAMQSLRRRLLELLRAEAIQGWSSAEPPPSPAEMLEVLQAFEQVRASMEPRWDQALATHLSGPGGLDLVVEVAHDLRSPLTSILFLSETLRKGQSGDINDVQRRQLGIIYSAALGLISVASDVIELARGGEHLIEREPSPFSVTETLQSVNDIVRPMAEEKGLEVRLVPPTADQRLGYPVALSRVLLNLTTNALKFTDEGFVEIVTRARGLRHLEFSVRDTGRGIDPDGVASLYEPFRRTGARRAGFYFSGSGLGLAICRKLIEAMNSRLELESSPERGSRFFFTIELPPASTL